MLKLIKSIKNFYLYKQYEFFTERLLERLFSIFEEEKKDTKFSKILYTSYDGRKLHSRCSMFSWWRNVSAHDYLLVSQNLLPHRNIWTFLGEISDQNF